MGRYSLSALTSRASAFLTDERTKGLPLSSRYAPTPRLILRGLLSALKASVTPRIGSGGPNRIININNKYIEKFS